MPPFLKKFESLYAGAGAPPEFIKVVAEAKCNVCHVPGKQKKHINFYGLALKEAGLDKSLTARAATANPAVQQAIQDAFDKAAQEESFDGPTYGELFKAGKMPR